MLFWTHKPIKITPQDTHIFLCGISKNPNLKLIIEFVHLLIIPMTLFNDIMPCFDEFIHVYGWNMSILWFPLKIWTPKNFTTANFRHPVSKSWLRHWASIFIQNQFCIVFHLCSKVNETKYALKQYICKVHNSIKSCYVIHTPRTSIDTALFFMPMVLNYLCLSNMKDHFKKSKYLDIKLILKFHQVVGRFAYR